MNAGRNYNGPKVMCFYLLRAHKDWDRYLKVRYLAIMKVVVVLKHPVKCAKIFKRFLVPLSFMRHGKNPEIHGGKAQD